MTLAGGLLLLGEARSYAAPVTVTPTVIDISAPEIVNPMRGLYQWGIDGYYNPEKVPLPSPSQDAYQRYEWSLLEQSQGSYDFSLIEQAAAEAKSKGKKFAFRVACVNEFYNSYSGEDATPEYLKSYAGGTYCQKSGVNVWVPDYDSPQFLERAKALVDALAAKFDGDPRISYYDMGIYGDYGEWHNYGLCPSPNDPNQSMVDGTPETKRAIVDMQIDAFKNTRILMNSGGAEVDAFVYALGKSPRIGVRCDTVEAAWFNMQFESWPPGCESAPEGCVKYNAMKDRWKTAPLVTDPMDDDSDEIDALVKKWHVSMIANASNPTDEQKFITAAKHLGYRFELRSLSYPAEIAQGRGFSVASQWANVGVTPLYEEFLVTFELWAPGSSAPAWSSASTLDLEGFLPTVQPVEVADCLEVPPSVAPGQYDLRLAVLDPTGYRGPLALAIEGVDSAGRYLLGSIEVKAAGAQVEGNACSPPVGSGVGGAGGAGGAGAATGSGAGGADASGEGGGGCGCAWASDRRSTHAWVASGALLLLLRSARRRRAARRESRADTGAPPT